VTVRRALGLLASTLAVVTALALFFPVYPPSVALPAWSPAPADVAVSPATTLSPPEAARAEAVSVDTVASPPVSTPRRQPPLSVAPTTTRAPAPRISIVATHPAGVATLAPARAAPPVHVRVDGAPIDGPIIPTGVDQGTGEFAVPPEAGLVGWYEYGPRPGDGGSAVLAGHLDWKHRPGVFRLLTQVRPGAIVVVTFADGAVRRFRVTENRLVLKPQLPTAAVFARTGPPTLRLITCGGEYDRSSHHYRSNVLVTAVPVA
jgi:hypothetical protein